MLLWAMGGRTVRSCQAPRNSLCRQINVHVSSVTYMQRKAVMVLEPHLCGLINVLVGSRADMQRLDDTVRGRGIHDGAADNLGHIAVVIGQVDLHGGRGS